ncbi:MAG: hypothetical protein E7164_00655 [Firmicutes bacterium]|nr:hypothetical protein [Bacillota bacterium]
MERDFIEVEDLTGEIQKIEIVAKVKDNNKNYILYTMDEILGDEVNVSVGYIYEKNNKIFLEGVESAAQINYIYSLLEKENQNGN